MDERIYEHYAAYRGVVDAMTNILRLSGEFILKEGETLDHILPVSFGFNWRIPPSIISDKRNIRVIERSENSKKGYVCTEIPKFIQKYMIETHHRCMKEKRAEGIRRAKENGLFTGRVRGSKESDEKFLNKPKIKMVVKYLNMGWRHNQISEEVGVHINTITKVKKLIKNKNYLNEHKIH